MCGCEHSALILTEALFEPGNALHEVVETDSSFCIAESDGDGSEEATVEAETKGLKSSSQLVSVERPGPVRVHAFEHALKKE